ncbi:unnamed protein product [Parnassius mnemosyne]
MLLTLLKNGLCGTVREPNSNSSEPKDMYVVRATVYQVGILTNKTDEAMEREQGNQEAITFYHHNGAAVNLSGISNPLMTNVTAQSMVGVAPVAEDGNQSNRILPWSTLEKLAAMQPAPNISGNSKQPMVTQLSSKSKRDVASVPVKVVNGVAMIPPENGVQSLALPPLLALNNNLSQIPVPIPNTSVVRYAKINTLVKTP